jgi:cellobiose phosphorylase (EC 2.4.1.20)
MGSHHVKLTLAPGESRQIIYVLGYHENPNEQKFDPPGSQTINKATVKPIIAKYRNAKNVKAAFEALGKHWDQLLGVYQVTSPDEHADRMVNIWNAYQCMATFNMSRSASSFETGIGRGLGFRDSTRIFWASCIWCRRGPANASSISQQPSCRPAAPTTIPAADQEG